MNDKYDFIETVRSKGTLRTIKHVISKRIFGEEDIIVVRVVRADTQYQQDIAHLVVEDEHPTAQGKKGRPLNVFIVGDFPQKEIAFHEGELIALGGGGRRISQNNEGNLELVFTSDDQSVILREDFRRYNKEDIFSKTAQFSRAGGRLTNVVLKTIDEIKKWIGCGLVAAVPKELTLNEASLKTVCRCNLVCKVLDTREIEPCLGIITVTDGSVCTWPFLTINKDKEVEFVLMNESHLSVDIFLTLKMEPMTKLKKDSYVRLYGIQAKTFPLPLVGQKNCVIFKIDGRNFSFESLVGSDRVRVSNIIHKSKQHNNTADVSHNIADDSSAQSSIVLSSDVSFTAVTSGPQHNTKSSDVGNADDNSQSILTLRAPPTEARVSNTQSKFPVEIQQSSHIRHKQQPFSGEKKRGPNRKERPHVDLVDGNLGSNNQGESCSLYEAIPPKRHKSRHRGLEETYCGISAPVNKCVDQNSSVSTVSHWAKSCGIAERPPCEASACVKQGTEQVRPENNAEGTEHDSITDEECTGDEPLILERKTGLRKLKYLPGIYHVNVWIKDVSPTLLGCPLDLITAQCYTCKKQQSYTRLNKERPYSEQQICLPCSSQGMEKFLALQFKFMLVLWDACEREISASVTGENAEKFLKCSVYTYTRDEAIRKQVWNTLQKLKDRGCQRKYRRAHDLIEVDIGVTVEKGFKKYMLLGGALNNLEFFHKQ